MKTSVCLTVFSEEKSVSDLLGSLLIQTKKPDEIVIVDGGSIDKTVDILRHFQKKDSRIRVLSKMHPFGGAKSFDRICKK